MKCPSCGAGVPAGETICLDCGTELVFALIDEPAPEPAAAPKPAAPSKPAREVPCPDCGERVAPDPNGLCPICGHDFGGTVEIDEDAFFEDPPTLEQAMEAERLRLLQLQQQAAGVSAASASRGFDAADPGASYEPPEDPPLPGDRHRTRYQTGGHAAQTPPSESVWLVAEGGQTVFFDGRMTTKIRLDVDQVLIGRRDPTEGHYPDIDLGHFRHIDGHISRRHARIYRQQGRWFLEDLCANDATFLNDKAHVLNGETVPLKDGDRVLISDSVAMVFRGRAA